jgi:hypothetical protein
LVVLIFASAITLRALQDVIAFPFVAALASITSAGGTGNCEVAQLKHALSCLPRERANNEAQRSYHIFDVD